MAARRPTWRAHFRAEWRAYAAAMAIAVILAFVLRAGWEYPSSGADSTVTTQPIDIDE